MGGGGEVKGYIKEPKILALYSFLLFIIHTPRVSLSLPISTPISMCKVPSPPSTSSKPRTAAPHPPTTLNTSWYNDLNDILFLSLSILGKYSTSIYSKCASPSHLPCYLSYLLSSLLPPLSFYIYL